MEYFQASDPEQIPHDYIEFNYQLNWVDAYTTQLQFTFNRPEYVSASIEQTDSLSIKFNDTTAFESLRG